MNWYSSLYETISKILNFREGEKKRVSYKSDMVSSLFPLWWSPVIFIDLDVDTPTFWREFWAAVLKKLFSAKEIFTLDLLSLLISPVFSLLINEFNKGDLAPHNVLFSLWWVSFEFSAQWRPSLVIMTALWVSYWELISDFHHNTSLEINCSSFKWHNEGMTHLVM